MMTAEQFWQYWDDKKWAKPSPEIVKPVCVAFAEAYHRTEAAAQLAEKEREIARLRFNLYHYAPFNGLAHTTACSIWREDGQGHAVGFEGDRGPCNCGCLENFQRARAEAAEQRLQEAQALLDEERERLRAYRAACGDLPTVADLRERLREREAELEQALKLMRNYARGAISAELFRTKTETLLAEFTARQPLPSPPKVQP